MGLFLRMENENAEALGDLDAEGVAAITAEAAEGAEEVASASGDVTEVDTAVGNALVAQSELTEIEGSLEEAAAEDGMTPREAEHVEARLERVAALLGTTVAGMGLSMRREHFGSTSSRVAATKMRLEGIREWGKKIWEALVKGWEWLKNAVTSFFGKITKNADSLIERLTALQGRVNGAAGKRGKAKKTELSTSAAIFSVDGKASYDTVIGFVGSASQYIAMVESCSSIMSKVTTSDEKNADAIHAVFTGYSGLKATKAPKTIDKKTVTHQGPLLPNGMGLFVIDYKATIGGKEYDSGRVEVLKTGEKVAENIKALTTDQMSKVLSTAIDGAKKLKQFNKIESAIKTSIEASAEFCKKKAKIDETRTDAEDESKQEKTRNSKAIDLLNQQYMHSLTKTVASKLPDAAFTVLSRAADLVDSHLANLEEKESKK